MKTPTFTHVLRVAIKAFPGGHNELSRRTGVSQPAVTRFVNGSDMLLSRADKLAAYLGIESLQKAKRSK